MDNQSTEPEKKKRGRKPKNHIENESNSKNDSNDIASIPKKRGRKPKGGTVVNFQEPKKDNNENSVKNIILHLRCKPSDLNKENNGNVIEDYKFLENKVNELSYSEVNKNNLNYNFYNEENRLENRDYREHKDNIKNLWSKVDNLSNNLHHNLVSDKKCACFHCTFDFDNSPIYIPKFEVEGKYHVYGCFCSPECACAFLMNEKNLDSSSKFERYQLLNYLYCKIYDYKKNIKPAPNPYYTLEKYFGNLTIQEYRQLLKNERLLLVIDKPLIRNLPELHEDNDIHSISNQNNQNNQNNLHNLSSNPVTNKFLMKTNEIPNKNNILSQQFAV